MIHGPAERKRHQTHWPPSVGVEITYPFRWLDWLITLAVLALMLIALVAAVSQSRPYEGRAAVVEEKS